MGRFEEQTKGVHNISISYVSCPFCYAPKGIPCRKSDNRGRPGSPYSKTHKARIKRYEAIRATLSEKI